MPTLLTAQDWLRLQEIFDRAVDLPADSRGLYLDEVCADAPDLRLRVVSLLSSFDGDTQVGELIGSAASATLHSSLPAIGGRLGPYKITGVLGQGGMGVVYRAVRDDDEYQKEVAIKVAAVGVFTGDLHQRFLHERQILANLDHPSIARLLDGGTTPEGMPFVVMEFVEGKPIDEYCSVAKLDRRARIELIIQVARAVDYAHRHLVVHRDLKPDNIHVTQGGEPKLLDFGIAKALDPETSGLYGVKTVDAMRLMTPDYASPEQVRGEAITTATDVYQLGVLLYLLLTGKRPFEAAICNMGELERAICETLPAKPNLDADLDRVLLQALEKEPSRRYSSAESLAEDLERYLGGFPVRARAGTFAYRSRKFVGRHKIAVAAASVVLLLILGFSVGIALLAQRLDRERMQMETQLHRSERVSQLLEDVFGGADPNTAQGRNPTARELLDHGTEEVGKTLDSEPEVQASLYSTLGHIYDNLGVIDRALDLMQRSLALRRKQYGENSLETAKGLNDVADLLNDKGEFKQAETMAREALIIRESLLGKSSIEVAETMNYLGIAVTGQGKNAEAEELYREAAAIAEPLVDQHNAELETMPLHNLSIMLMERGDYPAAEASARHLVALARKNMGEISPDTAMYLSVLGTILQSSGHYEEARKLFSEALDVEHRTLDPRNMTIGNTEIELGNELRDEGHFSDAEHLYLDAVQIESVALGPQSPPVAHAKYELARLYQMQGDLTKAEPLLRDSLAIDLLRGGLNTPGAISTECAIVEVLVRRGKLTDSRAVLNSAQQAAAKTDDGKGLDTVRVDQAASQWFVAHKEFTEAEARLRQALAIQQARLPAGHPQLAKTLDLLGEVLLLENHRSDAAIFLQKSVAIRIQTSPRDSPSLRNSEELLARATHTS
ncbi:serine/threonine-protein kinase [Acidicapsa acidisoli]|uniref:serine/threonine-protein kinase n=1 Tax=Acidicapsa acidisoli TaxID=1615681 RepID=UPI0021DFC592|nr:serine/threonine-protein kinase [Acidicapsa acidisoli]